MTMTRTRRSSSSSFVSKARSKIPSSLVTALVVICFRSITRSTRSPSYCHTRSGIVVHQSCSCSPVMFVFTNHVRVRASSSHSTDLQHHRHTHSTVRSPDTILTCAQRDVDFCLGTPRSLPWNFLAQDTLADWFNQNQAQVLLIFASREVCGRFSFGQL